MLVCQCIVQYKVGRSWWAGFRDIGGWLRGKGQSLCGQGSRTGEDGVGGREGNRGWKWLEWKRNVVPAVSPANLGESGREWGRKCC